MVGSAAVLLSATDRGRTVAYESAMQLRLHACTAAVPRRASRRPVVDATRRTRARGAALAGRCAGVSSHDARVLCARSRHGSGLARFPGRDEEFEGPLATEVRIEEEMLGDDDSTEWVEKLLARMLAPIPLSKRTRRFRSARKEILSHVASVPERQRLETTFVLPVHVGMWVALPAAATTIIETLAELQQQSQSAHAVSSKRMEEARRAALRVYPFRVASVDLIVDDETLSPTFMKSVHNRVTDGSVVLRDAIVRLADLNRTNQIDQRNFADFVTAVCAPSGESVIHDTPHRKGARAVRVEASLGLFPFVQLCSALTFSKGIKEVVVDEMLHVHDEMTRRQRWAMVLYALFSEQADNDIRLLDFGDFELTEGDLVWMKALFEAHHPIERLVLYALAENPLPTDVTTHSDRIVVKSNAVLSVCRGFQQLFEVNAHDPLTFYAFRSLGTGVEVIAPAFGNVVVPNEHIFRRKPLNQKTHKWWKLETHGIKEMTIRSFGDDDEQDHAQRMRNLAVFIGIIGRPLEALGLLCDLPQPEEFLDMVWPTCVNLKKLEMYYPNFQSLQYLVNAYESGKCNVQSLYLEELRLSDTSSMDVFIATLADPTSTMARTLIELRLMVKRTSEAFASGPVCAAIANALSTNETLRYLSVNTDADNFDDLKPLFDKLHNSWIPGFATREPFPMGCKCAFISVVERMNDRDQPQVARSSIALLDSRILSVIFEMSGTPQKRTVILRLNE